MKTQMSKTAGQLSLRSMARLATMALLLLAVFPALASAADAKGKAIDGPIEITLMVGLAIFAILVVKASLIACAILGESVYPRAAERAQIMLSARPIKFFVLGLIDAVAVGFLLAALAALANAAPIFSIVLIGVIVTLCVLLVLGLAGVYSALGRRCAPVDSGMHKEVLCGGAVLETATILPFLGWLGQAVVLCMALGAGLALLFGRRKVAEAGRADEPVDEPVEPGPLSNP